MPLFPSGRGWGAGPPWLPGGWGFPSPVCCQQSWGSVAGSPPPCWAVSSSVAAPLPSCLPACCLPGKGRRGRAGPCSDPPTPACIHSPAASHPDRAPALAAPRGWGGAGHCPRGRGCHGAVPGLSIIHGEFGDSGRGGTPVLTPQLVRATFPAHPVDAGAAPGTWRVQEVASAHVSVQWHWTLLPAYTGGTGDPHNCLAQGVGRGLARDPSLGT